MVGHAAVLADTIPFTGANLAQLTANGLISGSEYALVAVGFGMIIHVTGRFHIAYAAIYALAAFLVAELQLSFGWPLVPALLVAGAFGIVAALACELLVYGPLVARVGTEQLFGIFIASLGLDTAIEALINIIWQNPVTIMTKINPVSLGDVRITNIGVYVVVATWVLVLLLSGALRWTNMGRKVRAVRVNPALSLDFGIDPRRIYFLVFAVGTALGCVGAVLQSAQSAPASNIGENIVLYAITAAFMAGAGSSPWLIGVVALGMGLVQAWSGFVVDATWSTLVIFLILMIFVLIRAARTLNWQRLLSIGTHRGGEGGLSEPRVAPVD